MPLPEKPRPAPVGPLPRRWALLPSSGPAELRELDVPGPAEAREAAVRLVAATRANVTIFVRGREPSRWAPAKIITPDVLRFPPAYLTTEE